MYALSCRPFLISKCSWHYRQGILLWSLSVSLAPENVALWISDQLCEDNWQAICLLSADFQKTYLRKEYSFKHPLLKQEINAIFPLEKYETEGQNPAGMISPRQFFLSWKSNSDYVHLLFRCLYKCLMTADKKAPISTLNF